MTTLVLPSFVAAVVGSILIAYSLRIKSAHVNFIRIGVLLVGQFIFLVAYSIITGANEAKRSRLQLKSFFDNKNISITVDGKLLDSVRTKEFSEALASIANLDAHHSHTIDTIKIQMISGFDTLNLTLGQDSEIPMEYWVFGDKYSGNEIGRIRIKFFLDKTAF